MARLPALVDTLAAVGPRDRGAVDHIAREVREAGLIRTTTRGRGAAEMLPADAVALILALNTAESARNGIANTQRFQDMRPSHRFQGQADELPAAVAQIARAATFGEALERLIESSGWFGDDPDWRVHELVRQQRARGPVLLRTPDAAVAAPSAVVSFEMPAPGAAISLAWPLAGDPATLLLEFVPSQGAADAEVRETGRRVTVSLDTRTFKALHKTLFDAASPPPDDH